MNTEFNPLEWLHPKNDVAEQKQKKKNNKISNNSSPKIESYIEEIEQSGVDITNDYSAWRDIGFGISEEYGEFGRDYFHRISKNYANYDYKECDEQFTKCLRAKGHGITIATFYHFAHNAGIKPISYDENFTYDLQSKKQNNQNQKLPTIPDNVFDNLPLFLKDITKPSTSNEERDIILLGALTAFSACFPKVFGVYDQRSVYTNLYLFVTAPASAGKGRLNHIKNLVNKVHRQKREQSKLIKVEYEEQLAEYNKKGKDDKIEKPGKPPEKMLFIPANNSVTGVYQLLSDNDGKGLIFETEGDTLAQAFKSDYGNYSDGFRKAFQHETISYYRRTDREYVDIETPCLSTILSGTPKQIQTLIPSAENGLFSRFMFYYMNIKPIWKDVFKRQTKKGLDDYYDELGIEFFEFYKTLKSNPKIEIQLSDSQKSRFNESFEKIQTKYLNLQPEEYIATIRRLGLIAFRIMMLFTTFRIMEDGVVDNSRECEDIDFENALSIVNVLVKHSSKVYNDLPVEQKTAKRPNRKERFLESLPKQFNRQDYLDLATKQNIPHKTAEGYITKFVDAGLLHRDAHNSYKNLNSSN